MKLVRLDHNRCNEWDCSTYHWVDDDMTEEELETIVFEAKDEYLEFVADFAAKNKPPEELKFAYSFAAAVGYYPETMTIKEAKEKFEEDKEARAQWNIEKDKSVKGFSSFLESKGVIPFYKRADELISDYIDWGHNHGMDLAYREKNVTSQEFESEIYNNNFKTSIL